MKLCTMCNVEKEIIEFGVKRNLKDGHDYMCKLCRRAYKIEWSRKNPEKVIGYYTNFRRKLKDSDHAEFTRRGRNESLKKNYGITLDDFYIMAYDQNAACAICKKFEEMFDKRTNKKKHLCVDHDHKTGKVRGLLCHSCNLGLGKFKDNISSLKTAITYLSKGSSNV